MREFSKRAVLYLQSNHILYHFSSVFLSLNDLFALIKNMSNLSSPQDQVNNFIVNNAYSGQIESLRSNLGHSRNVMTKKIINSITPSLNAFLT